MLTVFPVIMNQPLSGKNRKGEIHLTYTEIMIERIRTLCEKRNFTINQLATRSGVSQSTLNNIMQGVVRYPRAVTLHRLAIGFNMTFAELVDFDALNAYSFEEDSESIE
jgi:transcriptional regulator with XRE-family HTH domain